MTGFPADWLALREPADRRARSARVLAATRLWADRRTTPGCALRVVDLGAGTGANLSYLAPHLAAPQTWTLVDNDPGLLALARYAGRRGRIAAMRRNGSLRVRAMAGDLAVTHSLTEMVRGGQLITASALFDLTSAAWCRRLVRAIARPGVALHAALTYDGRITIEPADTLDGMICHLFNRHQRRGKGFGAALGPRAAPMLARVAAASGAIVIAGRSDWRLGCGQKPLIEALLTAWATAACEMLPEHAWDIDAWRMRRRRLMEAGRLRVVVGHLDLLAIWPGRPRRRTSASAAYPPAPPPAYCGRARHHGPGASGGCGRAGRGCVRSDGAADLNAGGGEKTHIDGFSADHVQRVIAVDLGGRSRSGKRKPRASRASHL